MYSIIQSKPEVITIISDEEEEGGQAVVRSNAKEAPPVAKVFPMPNKNVVRVEPRQSEELPEPPAPGSPEVIPASVAKLSPSGRLNYIRKFWEQRRSRPHFCLRTVEDLAGNSVLALEALLRSQGKACEVTYEYSMRGQVICEYNVGLPRRIAGQGNYNMEARLNAAVEALKVLMTPLEFHHVNFISSHAMRKDINPEELKRALLAVSFGLSPKKVDSTKAPCVSQWTFSRYNILSQEEKESVLVTFWEPFFSLKRVNKFPRIWRLMGKIDFNYRAMDAFTSLFDREDFREETFFDGITYDEFNAAANFSWRVRGQVFQERANGSSREIAVNNVASAALEIVLGTELYLQLLHMNVKYFWKEISRERITNLIMENQERIPLEDAAVLLEEYLSSRGEPNPEISFTDQYVVKCTVRGKEFEAYSSTEEEARNEAACQALEHLFVAK